MQSLLAPAAQGRLKVWRSPMNEATTSSGDTAVYNDRYETEHHVMESLCLRRDLSRPESPPFGVWWTYTIEETLLWPILMFRGSMNRSLDVTMLAADDDIESEYEDNDLSEAETDVWISDEQEQRELTFAQDTPTSDRRGLDDGTVVPGLIASFLEHVHAKCPILHHRTLRTQAADLVENGLGWNAGTCKVVSKNIVSLQMFSATRLT